MHDLVVRNGTIVDGTGRERFERDVAIDGGRVAAVGSVAGRGRREIDAAGQVVAPGWVDVHTHYDGQVTWDPLLTPSSWHGVTTLVMGNCGVGFAPVRPGSERFLIELMEGVEDIPGTALSEGIDFRWESFPEYLDALDGMARVLDVAAQVPHCAIRAYVLGDRAHGLELTEEETEAMARLTLEGLRAGAVGSSTSRTILHRSVHDLVPGTRSYPEELLAIGRSMGRSDGAGRVGGAAGGVPADGDATRAPELAASLHHASVLPRDRRAAAGRLRLRGDPRDDASPAHGARALRRRRALRSDP
jgi:N-acyl-D-aspartate/D-glutamate deacylase